MSYYNKYLKYKNKYLQLQQQIGGLQCNIHVGLPNTTGSCWNVAIQTIFIFSDILMTPKIESLIDTNKIYDARLKYILPKSDDEINKLGINSGVKISQLGPGKLRMSGIKEGFIITEKNNINMALSRIFIAPRSGEQSSQNFAKTIDGGYLKADLIDYLSNEDKANLLNEVSLMIWGVKPSLKPRWDKMEIDDWVIFYQHGKITYVGKLLYKSHNKAFADNLWGPFTGQDGNSI